MEQPTNDELRIALGIARETNEYADLQRLRERRYSWFGDEIKLRSEIDRFIRARMYKQDEYNLGA